MTSAQSIDRHPVLVPRKDDLWLIDENAHTERYATGRTNERRVMLAKITPRGLESPRNYRASSPLYGRYEAPAAAFDGLGRIWMAYLQPRLLRGGWDLYFTGFNSQNWQPAKAVSELKGMDRRSSLVIEGKRAILAFQVDDFPDTWASARLELTDNARSRILLAAVGLDSAAGSPIALEPMVEPDDPFDAGKVRVSVGEDTPTPAVDYQGKTLKLYYGDLHTHSDISVCNHCGDQSLDGNYQHRS